MRRLVTEPVALGILLPPGPFLTSKTVRNDALYDAGDVGIEPTTAVLETAVIPFN